MANTQVITDVINFNVEEYSNKGKGKSLFFVDYASEITITSDAERLDISGGIGHYRLLSVDHTRTTSFNAKLPIVDLQMLAQKLGSKLTTGSKIVTKNEFVTLKSDTLTLQQMPNVLTGRPNEDFMRVYKVNGDRDIGEELRFGGTATASTVTLLSGTNSKLLITDGSGGYDANKVRFLLTQNITDELSVTASGDLIVIALANTTASKNNVALITSAIQALGTVTSPDLKNPISVADFTATDPDTSVWDDNTTTSNNAPAKYMTGGVDAMGLGHYSHTDGTKTITLESGEYTDGDRFFVTYGYLSGVNTKNINITGNNFPGFLRITGMGQVTDDVEGRLIPISFEMIKCKVDAAFDLSMTSGSNTEIDFNCDCYAVKDDDSCDRLFIKIFRLDDENVSC